MHAFTDQKKMLRKQLMKQRLALSADYRQQAAQSLCKQLLRLDKVNQATYLGVYRAIQGEISLRPFLTERSKLAPKPIFLLPIAIRSPKIGLNWSIWNLDGFPQPEMTAPIDLPQNTIFLIPGLGFSPQCHRIGYGQGYYDRFLGQFHLQDCDGQAKTSASYFGVSYDEQLISNLPIEQHDHPLDAIVTPTRVYWRHG